MLLEIGTSRLSSVKMKFCKTSQTSRKISKTEFLFVKLSHQAYNCTKKDTITGVFLWIYFFIFTFLFHERCFVKKKMFLKIAHISHTCAGAIFNKIAAFLKNTFFEEHLWTTACKKINIFFIVKVLLLRTIKPLNSNGNKKKKHMRKFDVRSHVTQELQDIGVYFNIFAVWI